MLHEVPPNQTVKLLELRLDRRDIGYKSMPEGRQCDASIAAHKDIMTDLLFQSRNGRRYHGLRNEQLSRSFVDRPGLCNSHDVF